MDSDSSNQLPNPKRLKTLAANVVNSKGNNLLHQFVLDNSDPNHVGSENYLNAVLLSMSMSGTSANALNDEKCSALYLAVLKNNALMVKKLISCLADIDVNTRCQGDKTALHMAAELGRLSIIQELLNKGADVNIERQYGHTALCFAVESCNLTTVELLVSKGADLSARKGQRALLCAVQSGNLAIVKFLFDRCVDFDINSETGKSLICAAANYTYLEIIAFLIGKGADVNSKDECGNTPLHFAVRSSNLVTVEFLVSNGADVNATNNDNSTPLHFGAKSKSLEIVEFLIGKGANVHAVDVGGNTPLHYAVFWDSLEILEFLVYQGADLHAINNEGRPLLYYAITDEGINSEIANFLIGKGTNLNKIYYNGKTLLHMLLNRLVYILLNTSRAEITFIKDIMKLKLLLEGNADVNIRDVFGDTPFCPVLRSGLYHIIKLFSETATDLKNIQDVLEKTCLVEAPPSNSSDLYLDDVNGRSGDNSTLQYNTVWRNTRVLHYAIALDNLDIVQLFLESGIDVNEKDDDGRTPLSYAVKLGRSDTVKLFLESKVDLNIRYYYGNTILHLACDANNCQDIIEMLLRKGSGVNATNNYNEVPLQFAVYINNLDYIQLLLERGANVNVEDINGSTPLHLAASRGYVEVIKVLMDKGADINAKNEDGKTPLDSAKEDKNQLCIDALQNIR